MKITQFYKSSVSLAVSAILASAIALPTWAASVVTNAALEHATIGFATQDGGTTGGAKASSKNIYLVSNISEFENALAGNEGSPRIIQIKGIIDVSGGKAYSDFNDQKKRSQLYIPSDTTIIGVNGNSGFKNGSLVVSHVENVIIRNLNLETPVDVAPHFEDGDGWNAEWDSMTVTYSKHVWVDHVTFDDGSFTDADYKQVDGWDYVQHDGELDIKHGSDFVTVSYSVFKNHNKTMLIGHSKNNAAEDEGHLRVTLADNIFSKIEQRTPRVRFGKVHAYNNLFTGDYKADTYAYKTSFGLGYEGTILSESNVFNIDNLKDNKVCKIVDVKQTNSALNDVDSQFNGHALDLSDCSKIPSNNLSWTVPYNYSLLSTSDLSSYLNKNAGAGHLSL